MSIPLGKQNFFKSQTIFKVQKARETRAKELSPATTFVAVAQTIQKCKQNEGNASDTKLPKLDFVFVVHIS